MLLIKTTKYGPQAQDVFSSPLVRVAPYVTFAVVAALVVGYLGAPGPVIVGLFLVAGLASAAILLRRRSTVSRPQSVRPPRSR